MKRLVLFSITVLFVLAMSHGMTQACQCQPPLFPEDGYEQADAVFRGWVIDISPTVDPYVIDITIAVVGYWKGTVTTYTHVYIGTSGGDCGYEGFELFEEYLIYAEAGSLPCCTGLMVSVCNRTRPIASAGTDLEYLGDPQTIPVEQMTWGAVKETIGNSSNLDPWEQNHCLRAGKSIRLTVRGLWKLCKSFHKPLPVSRNN